MISLSDFSIGYGNRLLLENVDSRFREESLTALIGRNGSGKSTLLRAICRLNDNYSGKILIDGTDLRDINASRLASLVSFVNTQRPQVAGLKCRDIVALGRAPYTDWAGNLSAKDREIVDIALESVGMLDFADRTLRSLSDGESQRIMIARAIAQDTRTIILDEPTSFLDMPNRYELVTLLKKLARGNGKTVIFSTHELDIAVDMCDDIALIDDRYLFNLPVEEMVRSGRIQKLFKTPGDFVDRLLRMILQGRQ